MQRINSDPSTNLVAFEVRLGGRLQTVIGGAPTRSVHSIELSWTACLREDSLQPEDVRQVYSEWEPSPEDTAFMETAFPGAWVTWSFRRPAADDEQGWELALREAAATIERSVEKRWWQFWK